MTPIDDGGRLDRGGLDRLLERVLRAGIAGVAPAGSTGEGPLLSQDLRVELTRAVSKTLGAEHWLIPGVPAATITAALEEIELMSGAGADAVLLPPPWYYPLTQAEVVDYFVSVADVSALPILLYNIPRLTKISIEPVSAAELGAHPMIVGMKDSSGDLDHLANTAAAAPMPVFVGTDALFTAALASGAAGAIGASVNIVPGEMCAIFEAHLAGRLEQGDDLQRRVAGVVSACSAAGYPVGWKAALELLGVCQCHPAPPLRLPGPDATAALTAVLEGLNLLHRSPTGP